MRYKTKAMPTLLFIFGFRFIIYTRDHNPPHIHAIKNTGAAKIGIYPNIYLMENKGLSPKDLKTVMSVAEEYQEEFLAKWIEYHGEIK